MMSRARLLFIAAIGLGLTACADHADNHDTNTVIGATFGGLLGAHIDRGASAPFANVGAINKNLNDEDRRRMQQAEEQAYTGPLGATVTWRNDASGHSGSIIAKSEHK